MSHSLWEWLIFFEKNKIVYAKNANNRILYIELKFYEVCKF
jgi:hypothetical protein